jgi:glyoxylase-like metal-dependent hydrolase (beta-lactamase superfamily II)
MKTIEEPIDLHFRGDEKIIALYLVKGDEPALVDCGPSTCLPALRAGLAARGLAVSDLRHLLLTHIHFDHAGAAGVLVRENPELTVHVSAIGLPHLADPARLEASARRVWGDLFDDYWGELAPIPEANLRVAEGSALGLEVVPTPGHARHHVSYLDDEGRCYIGDAAGVRIVPGRFIVPHAPAPDIDVEGWNASLDAIEERRPTALYLPHFGRVDEPEEHVAALRENIARWAERVRGGATEEEFVRAGQQELERESEPEMLRSYAEAAPLAQSFHGFTRYWSRRETSAAPSA